MIQNGALLEGGLKLGKMLGREHGFPTIGLGFIRVPGFCLGFIGLKAFRVLGFSEGFDWFRVEGSA